MKIRTQVSNLLILFNPLDRESWHKRKIIREAAVTIAACYLSPEGVVLGADSTTTYGSPSAPHYFNNAQKLFEIGENSTLGAVTWGLGGLTAFSHRTLLAILGDSIRDSPPASVSDICDLWVEQFWKVYTDKTAPLAPEIAICKALSAKSPFDPTATAKGPNARNDTEEKQFVHLVNTLLAGFCIAGRIGPERESCAFEIIFDPSKNKPKPRKLTQGWQFWGAPNMIQRLIFGCDDGIKGAILGSGKWNGTRDELNDLLGMHALQHPIIPIRDALDFVHACIASTIKAFKFSPMSQICGGPIELAVITSDRQFRWVRHKSWDAAINEGGT